MKNLAIIGAGNMGAAFCRGLTEALPNISVSITDHNAEKLKPFSDISTSTNPQEILGNADCVLLAVKPQSFDTLCEDLGDLLKDRLIISIMAGKTLETLREKTGSSRIVRSMPNLGAQVRQGITAWITSSAVTGAEEKSVRQMFQAVGTEIRMNDEAAIDSFTAIAGCGPAYFFRLCSVLAQEAEHLGFSKEDARRMAEQTFLGSAELLKQGAQTSEEWVKAVSSKGGLTEAALKHLAQSDIDAVMREAIGKSLERSKELSA